MSFADDMRLGRKLAGIGSQSEAKEAKLKAIDPKTLKELHCEHCDSIFWEVIYVWKIIPPTLAPDNKEHISTTPLSMNRCADCKKCRSVDNIENLLYPVPKND